MKTAESKAEIYLMALQSLSKREREAVISRLLEDPKLREDILDLLTIYRRRGEHSRPFREYVAETRK
jgi:hypothetical protein